MQKTFELVTIVTESILENKLTKEIMHLGAKGYTVCDVRGMGGEGYRSGDWSKTANIQISVICKPDVAEKIIDMVQKDYFKDYATIVYHSNINVLRSEKF